MNYIEWSKEYETTAAELEKVLTRLKREREGKGKSNRKELDDKIIYYRRLRSECLKISAHLLARSKGVA